MAKRSAILKLIRWPNLVFIALTQFLVYMCIVLPGGWQEGLANQMDQTGIFICFPGYAAPQWIALILLIISTVLIAASGYMINDYFDVRIDQVNKPDEVVLGKLLSRRAVLIWHSVINLMALLLVVKLAYDTKLRFLLIQFTSIAALIVYSLSFKRRLFIGNLLIGFLTSLSIWCIGIYEMDFTVLGLETAYQKFFWLYVVFAFIVTIIRELIKDAEDLKGDLSDGCKTVPIVYGIEKTKKIVFVLFFFLFGIIAAFINKMYDQKTIMCIYYLVGIIIPSILIMLRLQKATRSQDFSLCSRWVKWLTLSGILSMVLISF